MFGGQLTLRPPSKWQEYSQQNSPVNFQYDFLPLSFLKLFNITLLTAGDKKSILSLSVNTPLGSERFVLIEILLVF